MINWIIIYSFDTNPILLLLINYVFYQEQFQETINQTTKNLKVFNTLHNIFSFKTILTKYIFYSIYPTLPQHCQFAWRVDLAAKIVDKINHVDYYGNQSIRIVSVALN